MSQEVSVVDDFHKAVNMTAKELESWLNTDESKSVGQHKDGDDESFTLVKG